MSWSSGVPSPWRHGVRCLCIALIAAPVFAQAPSPDPEPPTDPTEPAASLPVAEPQVMQATALPPAVAMAPPAAAPDVPARPEPGDYAQRDDVQRFAASAAAQHGLDAAWVSAALARARYQPSVARLIMPAATPSAKNWAAYRARFIDESRLRAGLRWWQTHEPWLQQAQTRYGVPAEVIVSIVGIETFYGRIMGRYRVLDALATLSFDFPTGRSDRSAYFREELAQFLAMADRQGRDPTTILGSYAGAMGLPQFMPGSAARHAVDFDGDGRIDLDGSAADAVGSVAQFLVNHGWRPGLPTHYGVQPPEDAASLATLLAPDITPQFDRTRFLSLGAVLDAAGQRHEGKLALVRLENGGAAPSYVAGTDNFYVITRYNWSSYYAMAVIDFAAALRQGRAAAD